MTTFFDWYRAFNRASDVSTSARAVGNAMATRANSETLKFWMTIQEVSDFTGMSARNVIRKIDELDGAEWVVRLRRGRFGKASEYVLAVPHGDTSVTKEGHMVTPVSVHGDTSVTHMVTPVSVHGDTSVTPTTPKLPHVTTPKTTPRPDRAKTRNPYDPRFEKFWKTYPRKIGDKKKSQELFFSQLSEADAEELVGYAAAYAEQVKQRGTELRYVPYPSTWLSQQRWMEMRDFSQEKGKQEFFEINDPDPYGLENAPF